MTERKEEGKKKHKTKISKVYSCQPGQSSRCADYRTLCTVISEILQSYFTNVMSADAIRRKIMSSIERKVKTGRAGPCCLEINGNHVEVIPYIPFREIPWQEDEDEEYAATTKDDSDDGGKGWEIMEERKNMYLPDLDLEGAEAYWHIGILAEEDEEEKGESGVGGGSTDGEEPPEMDGVVAEDNDGGEDEDEDRKGEESARQGVNDARDEKEDVEGGEIDMEDILR